MEAAKRQIGIYPSLLARHRPPQALGGIEVVSGDDLLQILAAQPSLLAALYLPKGDPQPLPPLYALGPAVWRQPPGPLVGAAAGGQRGVAARALETLGGLLAEGPLPPSPRPLRLHALREAVGQGFLAVAGGGRVGRALQSLAKGAKVRCTLISDHAPKALRPVRWQGAGNLLAQARAVVWAADRPLAPHLPLLRQNAVLVVVSELGDDDRQALLATLALREATALAAYRPLELPRHERLVVLSDSPRRQAQAMASLWRHLAQMPPE